MMGNIIITENPDFFNSQPWLWEQGVSIISYNQVFVFFLFVFTLFGLLCVLLKLYLEGN
jgi:hypothetical protein